MKFASVNLVTLALFVASTFAAPKAINTDKIHSAVASMKCVSDVIMPIDEKHSLGDLWMPVYFPLVMHTNGFYVCENWRTQDESDQCVDKEMDAAKNTLNLFLRNLFLNNTKVTQDIHDAIVHECGVELMELGKFSASQSMEVYGRKLSLKKLMINVEHIKCVGGAIAIAIGNSELASTWIDHHNELKDAISKMVMCTQNVGINKKVCILVELHNTMKVMWNYWKFLADKKHLEVLNEIKTEIKNQCY